MALVKAIYPGTFDPITNGHLDIIARISKIFPELVIAIAEDTNKSPIFSVSKRVELAKQEITSHNFGNCKIDVVPFSGLLVDFAEKQNASVIIRGLRALADFEYEFQMSYMNHKIKPTIETLFLPANENGHFISSRFVKELARLGGEVSGFVSENIAKELYAYFQKK